MISSSGEFNIWMYITIDGWSCWIRVIFPDFLKPLKQKGPAYWFSSLLLATLDTEIILYASLKLQSHV